MKHIFLKFSKNIGLFGMAMLIGFSMFTSNCGGDDDNPVDDSDTEVTDTTTTTTDPMEFTSFSPGTGSYGDEITIYGENFDGDVEVYVNDKLQEDIVSVNDDGTELVFTLASNTYSGIVKLYRSGEDTLKSEDELIYEIGYDVSSITNFSENNGGRDIVYLEDGSYFISYNSTLIKYASDHEIDKKIIDNDSDQTLQCMFLDNNGNLYIADFDGRILRLKDGSNTVDTLVDNVEGLGSDTFVGITGDNEGNLYVTNRTGYQVVKVDIANPENITEVINTTDDATVGITFDEDYLYVTTFKGLIKITVETGDFEYFIDKDGGYVFSGSDIVKHPCGDLFVVDSDSEDGGLFRIISKDEIIRHEDLLYNGLGLDKSGDLYLTKGSVTKKLIIQ